MINRRPDFTINIDPNMEPLERFWQISMWCKKCNQLRHFSSETVTNKCPVCFEVMTVSSMQTAAIATGSMECRKKR